MSTLATDALQDVHTATNDVLKGYREMLARAEPDIRPLIQRLVDLHERHAAEQAAMLASHRDAAVGETSLQGTVNKAVVILRDWFTDLDRGTLPAVRQGEQALRDEYAKALEDAQVSGHETVGALIRAQLSAVDVEIARLPQH